MAFAGIEDLFGQIEVIIWPSTWDETQDLWAPDRVLVVRGKIDAARGEPKLLCEEATNNLELIEVVSSPTVPSPVAPTYEPDYSYNGYDAHPIPEEDWSIAIPTYEEQQPPEAKGLEIEEPAQQPDTNVSSESSPLLPHFPQPVLGMQVASIKQEVTEDRPSKEPMRLRIFVQRSGDPERDKRRLRHIHGTLISYPGQDTFSIVLFGEGRIIEVDFPNETTQYCAELKEKLAHVIGPDAIQIVK